jgi:hypothetical protein
MSFRHDCQECAARLVAAWEDVDQPIEPGTNDTRLCSKCHVFDDEEDNPKRIPTNYVNNPTDYL